MPMSAVGMFLEDSWGLLADCTPTRLLLIFKRGHKMQFNECRSMEHSKLQQMLIRYFIKM